LLLRFDWQVSVLVVEDVVVQNVVIAPFFFEELSVDVYVLLARVDSSEVTSPFIF